MLAASHRWAGLRKWFGEEGRCPQNYSLWLLLILGGHRRSRRPLRIREGVLLRGSPPRPPRLCLMSPAFSPLFEFPSGPALGTFMSRCVSTRTSRPFWGFPGGSEGKESTCKVGSIPGSGRFPWRREWQPIPVFLPGESHGQGRLAGSTVHGAAKSRTRLSD